MARAKQSVGAGYKRIKEALTKKIATVKGLETVEMIESDAGQVLYVDYGPEHEDDIGKLERNLVSVSKKSQSIGT